MKRHLLNHTAPHLLILFSTLLAPIALGQENPKDVGRWGEVMKWPNVAIHMSLLPNGKVLFWGRREWQNGPDGEAGQGAPSPHPGNPAFQSLDPDEITPRLWNSSTGQFTVTPKPKDPDGNGFNLFCAGHTILSDGRVLVVGGHIQDVRGEKHATIYDPGEEDSTADSWTAIEDMNDGRWYPTAIVLADGRALVSSGSIRAQPMFTVNITQQVLNSNVDGIPDADLRWSDSEELPSIMLYPRLHLSPDGGCFSLDRTPSPNCWMWTRKSGTL
jgi:galactose oxidase